MASVSLNIDEPYVETNFHYIPKSPYNRDYNSRVNPAYVSHYTPAASRLILQRQKAERRKKHWFWNFIKRRWTIVNFFLLIILIGLVWWITNMIIQRYSENKH